MMPNLQQSRQQPTPSFLEWFMRYAEMLRNDQMAPEAAQLLQRVQEMRARADQGQMPPAGAPRMPFLDYVRMQANTLDQHSSLFQYIADFLRQRFLEGGQMMAPAPMPPAGRVTGGASRVM